MDIVLFGALLCGDHVLVRLEYLCLSWYVYILTPMLCLVISNPLVGKLLHLLNRCLVFYEFNKIDKQMGSQRVDFVVIHVQVS